MTQSDTRVPLRISVVIPAYNARNYVGRAIRSALEQTCPPMEVIVVDDGSKDDTGKIIRREFGNQVMYHYQENGGQSAARNKGIKLSSGDWIAFLDDDDWWAPEKLELQVAEIARHPDAALVACAAVRYNLAGEKLSQGHLPQPFTRKTVREELKFRTTFPTGGALVRRDAFAELGGFREDLTLGEDREMWARIVCRYEVAGVDRPLLNVTDLPTSQSSRPEIILRAGPVVNRMVLDILGDHRSWQGRWKNRMTLQRADARVYFSAAWAYFQRNQRLTAAITILRSLACWPFGPLLAYKLAARLWWEVFWGGSAVPPESK